MGDGSGEKAAVGVASGDGNTEAVGAWVGDCWMGDVGSRVGDGDGETAWQAAKENTRHRQATASHLDLTGNGMKGLQAQHDYYKLP